MHVIALATEVYQYCSGTGSDLYFPVCGQMLTGQMLTGQMLTGQLLTRQMLTTLSKNRTNAHMM